ncbi:DUF4124 domain-containing protein [Herbaspirillum sp. SJZ107]|uniref:DUF4124 domain-containing protein n=1 Tax=Herbaspirillum sp. SJZ107 TaxID=2572881 RepID=UPI00114DCFBB|nr:DUF4124 domain-containing protein [Herbaspirillum sp. SJZ107]TQK03392.1 uncharacterized protein DUF4124 [Herbaspirillum sp. SJZ107]
MTRHWRRACLAGALMLLAQLAHAQYSWIDEKGTRVFSDRPPPPGTPAARILQMPRSATPAVAAADAGKAPSPAAGSAAATAAATPKPPTLAEQETAYRERQAKREEDARKARESAEQKAALDERCASARQEERLVTSGTRMSAVDAKGERYFLSDEERAKRLQAARRALQDCR